MQHQEDDWVGASVTHPGEVNALTYLTGALEKTVVESFGPRYNELLFGARNRLAP